MDDSDEEYIDYISPDDPLYGEEKGMSRRTRNRSSGQSARQSALAGKDGGYSWEDQYQRSWDVVQEDAGGSLAGVVAGIAEDNKKKRVVHDDKPVQRGIIRNLILMLDMSSAMMDKDLRPNRYQVMLNYAIEFITEFFDQNPISQLGIIGMKDGLAILVSPLDGNPHEHIKNLQALKKKEPKGSPSLQNGLEACKGLLFHVPSHCTKEIMIVFGALLTSDPGDIHQTINDLVKERIRVKVIGLAAQVAICNELAMKTNFNDQSAYGVVLNEHHFKDLFLEATTPLAISSMTTSKSSTLVEMGFPSRISETEPTMCADRSTLTQGGYICPRCKSKVSNLPTVCPCCSLTLIMSTHLARSYHHLFPLQAFKELKADDSTSVKQCFACLKTLPPADFAHGLSHRYQCPKCEKIFCIDCDIFCHETLYVCPGCTATNRRGNLVM